jgi:hypothetical protein
MWLMYPVTPAEVRQARQGVVCLLAASAVWFLTAAAVVAVRADDILYRVRAKFEAVPDEVREVMSPRKGWFYVLAVALALSCGLRFLGYLRLKNVAGAVAAGDGIRLGIAGVAVSVCTPLVLPVGGLGGLLAVVMAVGAALELQFLRAPAQLFGLVVSAEAAKRVALLRTGWVAWLLAVAVTALLLLVSQGFNDLVRNPGTPTDRLATSVCGALRLTFNVLATLELLTLPVLVGGYWLTLLGLYSAADKLTDPRGAIAAPPPPDSRPVNLLKDVLQNPYG